jgi:hypothetical protein
VHIGGINRLPRTSAIAGIPLSIHLYIAVSAQMLLMSQISDCLEWNDWTGPAAASTDTRMPSNTLYSSHIGKANYHGNYYPKEA